MNGIIHIDWDGPYHIEQINELNDRKKDCGIYQIYGTHPVYPTFHIVLNTSPHIFCDAL